MVRIDLKIFVAFSFYLFINLKFFFGCVDVAKAALTYFTIFHLAGTGFVNTNTGSKGA